MSEHLTDAERAGLAPTEPCSCLSGYCSVCEEQFIKKVERIKADAYAASREDASDAVAAAHARWHAALNDLDRERRGPIREHIEQHDQRVRAEVVERIRAEREGFLNSPNLAWEWIAGWHSAVDHVVRRVERR